MSQTDLNVANASGASVRTDINAHLDALATLSSGATEPSTTFPNMFWVDTSTNLLKMRNTGNTNWITIGILNQANLALLTTAAFDVIALGLITKVTTTIFTADGTYTKPADLLYITVEVQGAGGGGGYADTNGRAGGGGAGGGYSREVIVASALSANETVTVGDGGAKGVNGQPTGGTGETSSFGSHLSATGGGGGIVAAAIASSASGSTGGVGVNGDFRVKGSGGGVGDSDTYPTSGQGGSSVLGGGSRTVRRATTGQAGSDGVIYGGGAEGGVRFDSSGNGGLGAKGIVILTEFRS